MKKVSAIIATYNSADTISRTISSILGQQGIDSEFEMEVIVVDDHSTDNTLEIVDGAGIIHYSTSKNSGGPNTGRNIGLRKATGDYICIVDHDDEWKPDRIISLLPHLDRVPVVSSGYTRIDIKTGRRTDFLNHKPDRILYYAPNETFLSKLKRSKSGQGTYIGSLMYRRELSNVGFEEHFGCVDYDWLLRLFQNNDSIEVNRPLYLRYVEGDNLSLNPRYREMDYQHSLKFIETLAENHPNEVALAKKRINGTRARYHYVMGEMNLAREYFKKSEFSLKTLAYYLTTFVGSDLVNKNFDVFKS